MSDSPHLSHLVEKTISDFSDKVEKEQSLSNLLLKGHLFAENLLEEILAVFDYRTAELSKLGFSNKINCLLEISKVPTNHVFKEDLKRISQLLFALNEVRNNLAHDLHFEITEASVNKIGLLLGSEYIVKKYEIGYIKVRDNLLFCLKTIVGELGRIIYIKAEFIKESSTKKEVPKLPMPEVKTQG